MATRLVNGKIIEMTSVEEIKLTEARNKANEFQTAWDNVDEEKLTELNVKVETINKLKKAKSGKQKLKDLGLDGDEIQALIGV
jgi:alcohol dehydrogenase class IV